MMIVGSSGGHAPVGLISAVFSTDVIT